MIIIHPSAKELSLPYIGGLSILLKNMPYIGVRTYVPQSSGSIFIVGFFTLQ
jgi:hypothetical protein